MKNWGLFFLCFFSIKVYGLCYKVSGAFSLQFDHLKNLFLIWSWAGKYPFLFSSPECGPAENLEGMYREGTHWEKCCLCLGKEDWCPIGLPSGPCGFRLVGGPASQPSLFSCDECSSAAATGKHILLEEMKSLTTDEKIHVPGNWW